MPLDGVAFSRLDLLYMGRIFNRVTRGCTFSDFIEVRLFSIFTVSKRTGMFVLQIKSKVACSSFNLKNESIHKNRK